MNIDFRKGFTLIELLVVIAIIAIIASVVMGYTYSATVRGRDSRRKQDVDQIVKAVNLYFSEKGTLPMNTTGWCTYISNTNNNYGPDFQTDISPYMKTMTFDPTKRGMVGDYLFHNIDNTGGHFNVCTNMEQSSASNGTFDKTACTGGTTYNYCISQ